MTCARSVRVCVRKWAETVYKAATQKRRLGQVALTSLCAHEKITGIVLYKMQLYTSMHREVMSMRDASQQRLILYHLILYLLTGKLLREGAPLHVIGQASVILVLNILKMITYSTCHWAAWALQSHETTDMNTERLPSEREAWLAHFEFRTHTKE